MKLATIIGARPQFIKAASVSRGIATPIRPSTATAKQQHIA